MALSDTRDYILAIESNKEEAARIATATARKLEQRQATLIDIVQSLGEYINDEDDKIRARAISYLTAITTALPPAYLTRQQIDVLCTFLCQRIEDGNAIEGLTRLQSLDRFTRDMVQTVVKAIFEHFSDLQSRNQAGRHKILLLVNELMQRHRKAMKDMGDVSLTGIINLVQGEKDPRNLMVIFAIIRVLMLEWDISQHTELMFDSVYAYFPITFRPPPNDPYGITAQDLKDRLKDCLASTGELAPHTIPNLLDRLDSTSPTVKKDVLQALAACAQNYGTSILPQYSITLWDAVKFEILQAQEPELADEALLVIKAIAATLSTSNNTSPTSSPSVQFLKPISKECLEHLQEPAARQAKAAGDILKAAASASVRSFEFIIKSIGPALLTIYQSADAILQKRATLDVANQLFEAAIEVYGSWSIPSLKNPDGRENLLNEFKDRFVGIYSQALMSTPKQEVSFRLTAAKGLLLVSKMRALLSDDEIGMVVQYFNDLILREESYGRDELRQSAMSALAEISKFKPRLIADITFPVFMAKLPDNENDAKSCDYQSVLQGLAEISVEKELLETLMRRLLNKLDMLFRSTGSGPFLYTSAILGTVKYALERAVGVQSISLDPYFDRVVVGLSKATADAHHGPLADAQVLDLLGRVANTIVRHSAPERAALTADNVHTLFRSATNVNSANIDKLFPLPSGLILSTWLLAAVPRNLTNSQFDGQRIASSITNLSGFTRRTTDRAIEATSLRQIALYVNKHLSNADLSVADKVFHEILASLNEDTDHPEPILRLLFFLTKALVLRLAPNTNLYLQLLLDLLGPQHPISISRSSAGLFQVILSKDDILSRANFAQIRLLAPKRVFQTLTPLISDRFRATSSAAEKENYLIALSGILSTVPSEIVIPELPILLPLLLQSLDISDPHVKTATLETLAVVITSNPTALEGSGHLSALCKRLLASAALPQHSPVGKQTTAHSQTSPRMRRLATRCITLMPKYITGNSAKVNPLLALKKEVLQGLMAVLDDPKRDVRKEAVDARAAWLRGVDDIEEDDDEE